MFEQNFRSERYAETTYPWFSAKLSRFTMHSSIGKAHRCAEPMRETAVQRVRTARLDAYVPFIDVDGTCAIPCLLTQLTLDATFGAPQSHNTHSCRWASWASGHACRGVPHDQVQCMCRHRFRHRMHRSCLQARNGQWRSEAYTYGCMYVWMYVRLYVCMYVCMYACVHASVFT